MASLIPTLIPDAGTVQGGREPSADPSSLYDVAINGQGFVYSNTPDEPMQRGTAPFEKTRVDQAVTPGEQTLTGWWMKSQESFHGGAGQLNLESATPSEIDHIRFDQSKNVDVSTPGRVTRLPDTAVVFSDAVVTQMVGLAPADVDAVAYLAGTTLRVSINAAAVTPVAQAATGVPDPVLAIATDGASVFAATATGVWRVDPTALTLATRIATYTTAVGPVALGWAKARLMLGVNGSVYELDSTLSSTVTLGDLQLRYSSPVVGFRWRCFAESPSGILAAGDSGGQSSITEFGLATQDSLPVLQVNGSLYTLPFNERVLSMHFAQGSFLAVGTNRGVRVGTFDSLYGRLTMGPLQLTPNDPVIPCNAVLERDRFLFAVGKDYDEGGLVRLDLGTKVDQAGRYAWTPDLIGPGGAVTAATCGAVLPISGRILFAQPGVGVLREGVGPGTLRASWIRTSRVRFSTTELKLFKWGRVRGDFEQGSVRVTGLTQTITRPLVTAGFTPHDPEEFRLPSDPSEWLQLRLQLDGAGVVLQSWGVKALPGARRQRLIKLVLACFDQETTKTGQRIREASVARSRLAFLEQLDAAGDEVVLQEFTPTGVVSTVAVIENLTYTQRGRPTKREDFGGDVTVTLRTVES